jgi:high-affinity Fe2+/Pb2+ permease
VIDLSGTTQTEYSKVVYRGVFSGIVVSIIGALLFVRLAGGFTGRAEQIFEGTTMPSVRYF